MSQGACDRNLQFYCFPVPIQSWEKIAVVGLPDYRGAHTLPQPSRSSSFPLGPSLPHPCLKDPSKVLILLGAELETEICLGWRQLCLVGVYFGSEFLLCAIKPYNQKFSYPQLTLISLSQNQNYLTFLRHQSLRLLLAGTFIFSFPSVRRSSSFLRADTRPYQILTPLRIFWDRDETNFLSQPRASILANSSL